MIDLFEVTCTNCNTNYELPADTCPYCGYPIDHTLLEKIIIEILDMINSGGNNELDSIALDNPATLAISPEHNGVEIYFDSMPRHNVLDLLSQNGWKWHKSKRCWYSRISTENLQFASRICKGRIHNSLDEEKRKTYLTSLKSQFPHWQWHEKYDYYSLSQLKELRKLLDYQEASRIISDMPEILLEHFGKQGLHKYLSCSIAQQFLLLGNEYIELHKYISDAVSNETKSLFKKYYNELNRELQLSKAIRYSKTGKSVCAKCGKFFEGYDELCPKCYSHIGLDTQLHKIDLKLSSFWKNLAIWGETWEPIGIAKNFNMYSPYPTEFQSVSSKEIMAPSYSTSGRRDSMVIFRIQLFNYNVAKSIISEYDSDVFINDHRILVELAIRLYLCSNHKLAEKYIDNYCLKQCELKWHKLLQNL